MIERPIRVLHSFASLNRGGIETWLMNILREHPPGLHFDFLLDRPGGVYEEEARSHGCHIYHRASISRLGKRLNIIGLGRQSHCLEEVLTADKHDVFHMHGSEFLGDGMKAATRMDVPVRIAHAHGTRWIRERLTWEWRLRYLRVRTVDRYRLLKYATDIVACSNDAGLSLMGRYWKRDPRCSVLYCGVPLDVFERAHSDWTRSDFRKKHGIPQDAVVVGHVGSMGPSPVKNHGFLLDVFGELAKRDARYYLYMAGDGPLRRDIERMVHARGLDDRVSMPGLCSDVPSLMIHGFDVHVLPSLHEGLPVVGLEAVASGCFTVCSDTITREFTESFAARVSTVSLRASASLWADRLEAGIRNRISAEDGIGLVKESCFSISASLESLLRLYRRRLTERPEMEQRGRPKPQLRTGA
ncbi:MAG: glycosyltransferase [Phycisphaerae bacterium]|nr:glycosyltransferase [Phycisphaerae bacterium]